jgi:hypothetical protein
MIFRRNLNIDLCGLYYDSFILLDSTESANESLSWNPAVIMEARLGSFHLTNDA